MKKIAFLILMIIPVYATLTISSFALSNIALRTAFKENNEAYLQSRDEYKKLATKSSSDKTRIEGARKVMKTLIVTFKSYTDIYDEKDVELAKPTKLLTTHLKNINALDERVDKAKTLDELKKCLTDAKKEWESIRSTCKYIETKWRSEKVREVYLRLIEATEGISDLSSSKETLSKSLDKFDKEVVSELDKMSVSEFQTKRESILSSINQNLNTLKEEKDSIDSYSIK